MLCFESKTFFDDQFSGAYCWFFVYLLFRIGLLAIVYCASDLSSSEFFDEYNEFTCPERCNEWYSPVCGRNDDSNNKMFVNPCYMSLENCRQPSNKGLIRDHIFLFCFWFLFFLLHAYKSNNQIRITQFKSNKNQKK